MQDMKGAETWGWYIVRMRTGFNWLRTVYSDIAGSCERRNEPSGSINGGTFLHQLRNYQLLKDAAPWRFKDVIDNSTISCSFPPMHVLILRAMGTPSLKLYVTVNTMRPRNRNKYQKASLNINEHLHFYFT